MAARLGDTFRSAFVTGVSSGLGRSFALMLAREGVHVWGTSRDGRRMDEVMEQYPKLITPLACDLTRPEEAAAAFGRASLEAGGFDLLVNNAGFGVFGEFSRTDFAAWQAQIEAMLLTTMRLTRLALPAMERRGRGTVVNVASMATEFPLPFMTGYNVAKAGLSAFSESLMFEMTGKGVTVIDLRPGDFRTAFNQAMNPSVTTLSDPASRPARAWSVLEKNLHGAPPPCDAAWALRRALQQGRSGVVRTGSFFQTVLAPWAARLLPKSVSRALTARYFGVA